VISMGNNQDRRRRPRWRFLLAPAEMGLGPPWKTFHGSQDEVGLSEGMAGRGIGRVDQRLFPLGTDDLRAFAWLDKRSAPQLANESSKGTGGSCGTHPGTRWFSTTRVITVAAASLLLFMSTVGLQARSGSGKVDFRLTSARAKGAVGPQPTIRCPSGAVRIRRGTQIQPIVNAHPNGSAFCLKAGVHSVTSTIYPKTGQSFIGEYGAVLDGGRSTNIAFKDGGSRVTIRNLEIRNFGPAGTANEPGTPRGAVYSSNASGWMVNHNDIHDNAGIGIAYHTGFRIRYNMINRNAQYGLNGYMSSDVIVEYNEIAYNNLGHFANADEGGSKFVISDGLVIRGNDFHDNYGTALWLDTKNRNVTIENNVIRHNERHGLFYENSYNGVIRNNLIARNGYMGIYVAGSRDVKVYRNRVKDSRIRDIMLFMEIDRLNGGYDLANVVVRDNVIRVQGTGGLNGVYSGLSVQGMDATPYYNSKGNRFNDNVWYVSDTSSQYWYWNSGILTWSAWRRYGQDTSGRVRQRK
jgi:parallel beta-helix repeat protein